MTKLISVRVTVPTGDAVTTDALQAVIRELLEERSTIARGTDELDLRIHWSAVAVVRIVERTAAAEKRPARKPPAQGKLT